MSPYRAGIFTVVELTSIGLLLKWDRTTRVYLKLDEQRWKGRVEGLCGNYNGDVADDFTSPSKGVETNALIFGHSWRLDDSCMSEDYALFLSTIVLLNLMIFFLYISLKLPPSQSTHANWFHSGRPGRRKSVQFWSHQYSVHVIQPFHLRASTNAAYSMRAHVIRVRESLQFLEQKKTHTILNYWEKSSPNSRWRLRVPVYRAKLLCSCMRSQRNPHQMANTRALSYVDWNFIPLLFCTPSLPAQ